MELLKLVSASGSSLKRLKPSRSSMEFNTIFDPTDGTRTWLNINCRAEKRASFPVDGKLIWKPQGTPFTEMET